MLSENKDYVVGLLHAINMSIAPATPESIFRLMYLRLLITAFMKSNTFSICRTSNYIYQSSPNLSWNVPRSIQNNAQGTVLQVIVSSSTN